MSKIDVLVLFQLTIMFFCFYFQITLLTLRKLQLEHNLKKKKSEQQAHENFAAENKEDLYHGASKSRRKSRQVTMVSVETASQKGAPDH